MEGRNGRGTAVEEGRRQARWQGAGPTIKLWAEPTYRLHLHCLLVLASSVVLLLFTCFVCCLSHLRQGSVAATIPPLLTKYEGGESSLPLMS